MPYIPLKENLPGITGLLDYRLDTALPIRQLTHILLRGESTLSEGEREMKALLVIARAVGKNGRLVTSEMVEMARTHGATDADRYATL